MISSAAAQQHLTIVWYLLAAGSAGAVLHAGLKYPWFVFFQKDSGLRPDEPPWNMKLAMTLLSGLCIGLGVVPGVLYALLPYPVDFVPYTRSHLIYQLQLLLFSGLAFFLMLGALRRALTITLDTDWLWRGLGPRLMKALDRWSDRGWDALCHGTARGCSAVARGLYRHNGPDGTLSRTWPTGSMAFWTTLVLAAYLLLSFL